MHVKRFMHNMIWHCMAGCLKGTAIGCWKKWKMLQPWDMYQQLSSRTVQSFHEWLSSRLLRLYVV
jgi:hypothetical protein